MKLNSKKKINLFLRKPVKNLHFSIENAYYELVKNFRHKNLEFNVKVAPFTSKGFFRRLLITIWAFFNQGDINHICGDINFISFFLNKKKTINTILDHASMERLTGIKRLIYYFFWVKIPIIKSSKVICISNKTKKELLSFNHLNEDKLCVSGVCISSIYQKKIKKFNSKKPKILIVGTRENKNIGNILMSVINLNCEIIIIGTLTKYYFSILKKNKIKYKNLISISNKKLLKKYFESDVLLFPSKYEGFGMPILEAQSVGRVVITSNIEPMTSVGGNGAFYVNPHRIESIRNGLNKIIKKKKT